MSRSLESAPGLRQLIPAVAGVSIITSAVYFLALRILFPGYLHPLAPFHSDFYDYTAAALQPYRVLLHLPRPAAFVSMHLLGLSGLRAVIGGSIVITLAGVSLTLLYLWRLVDVSVAQVVALGALYSVLVFGHPQFYFEHRHDLPAGISYLALILCLHLWLTWTRRRSRVALVIACCACVIFAFSKETYFLSAPCLALGVTLYHRPNWHPHSLLLIPIILCEVCSLLYSRHVGSPFVNPAGVAGDYHIDLSLPSLANTYWYYLQQVFTPASLLSIVGVLALLGLRKQSILACTFVLAGLLTLIPHAILPNHKISEYAWLPVPLLFGSLLLLPATNTFRKHPAGVWMAIIALTLLSFTGRLGYRHRYRDVGLQWYLDQERRAANCMRSWPALKALPPNSQILVAGLDTPFLPWTSPGFTRLEFGAGKSWIILKPPSSDSHNTSNARFISLADFPVQADFAASYDEQGALVAIQTAQVVQLAEKHPSALVPQLSDARTAALAVPASRTALLHALDSYLSWGDFTGAGEFISIADRASLGNDAWICFFKGRLAEHQANWTEAARGYGCAVQVEPQNHLFSQQLANARAHQRAAANR